MQVSFCSAIFVGAIIGALGRLFLPGRQPIGWLWTIVVGIVAALIGSAIAVAIGVANTAGFDWIELLLQIGLAVLGVALVAGFLRNRSGGMRR